MSTPRPKTLLLETLWNPPADGKEFSYVLRLKNLGSAPISGFSLCISGPGRVDPAGRVEGATVSKRLSNFTEFQPPADFVLAAGETWTVAANDTPLPSEVRAQILELARAGLGELQRAPHPDPAKISATATWIAEHGRE